MGEEFRLVCDRCDKLTANPLVDWSFKPPMILCQRCYALVRAKGKYDRLPKIKQIPLKPKAYVKDNRYVVCSPIKKVNTSEIKIEFYENDKRVGWDLVTNTWTASHKKNQWLNGGELPKSKGRKSIAMSTEKSGDLYKNTKAYQNKLKYVNKWRKDHMTALTFYLHNEKDAELIEFIRTAPSKAELLREMYKAYTER